MQPTITKINIRDLKRADYNPRVMPDHEMEALIRSIKENGFIESIVVNNNPERANIIIGGHQRLTAVERLIAAGHIPKNIESTPEGQYFMPAIFVDIAEPVKEKELNIALNKIHGKFDDEKLYQIILDIKDSASLPVTGFKEEEISRILDSHSGEEDDDEPGEELPSEPISKPGEIYELGPHRLICGDSTDPMTYAALFGNEKPNMIWTDPPYNVDYEGKTEEKMKIKNDKMSPADFKIFIDKAFTALLAIAPVGASFYICSGWSSYPQFLDSMLKNGFHHSGVIIWVKNNATFGFSDYHYKHEWIAKAKKADKKTAEGIIYGWKNGTHEFQGSHEFDVWEMPRRTANKVHPTEKPDWLIMRAIRNSSKRNEILLDPFAGSGSLMLAAEKTGRRAYMIELDPKFCDVIRKRWEKIEKIKNNEEAEKNRKEMA